MDKTSFETMAEEEEEELSGEEELGAHSSPSSCIAMLDINLQFFSEIYLQTIANGGCAGAH